MGIPKLSIKANSTFHTTLSAVQAIRRWSLMNSKKSPDGYEQCWAGYRPPIVVGDSPPYEFYAEFPTFYDAINVERWTFIFPHSPFPFNQHTQSHPPSSLCNPFDVER
jgi:hypothetical protein